MADKRRITYEIRVKVLILASDRNQYELIKDEFLLLY